MILCCYSSRKKRDKKEKEQSALKPVVGLERDGLPQAIPVQNTLQE